jgi:hypothetical protein
MSLSFKVTIVSNAAQTSVPPPCETARCTKSACEVFPAKRSCEACCPSPAACKVYHTLKIEQNSPATPIIIEMA